MANIPCLKKERKRKAVKDNVDKDKGQYCKGQYCMPDVFLPCLNKGDDDDDDVALDNYSRGGGGGVLDISLSEEVRRGPSYPDPVQDKYR